MESMSLFKKYRAQLLFWFGLTLLYFLTHLPSLTQLPVFSDEAIYIRWAQLIISDWQQYLFFPLNDGKTPLYIWMLVPLVRVMHDPLWAGRLLSVLGGYLQMIVVVQILKQLKVNRIGQLVGALIVVLAPFWFFHHRMVLMDGWLTVWISLAVLSVLKIVAATNVRRKFLWIGLGAVSVWAGLMTKIPFVLAFPSLVILPFKDHCSLRKYWSKTIPIWLSLLLGSLLFLTLAASPVFPQLFSRGGDFLMPVGEVISGRWHETIPSIPTYIGYFFSYAGWGVVVLAAIGVWLPRNRRATAVLLLCFVLFSLPIWVLGRVVYPRYLFPAMLFLTLAAGTGAGSLWQWSLEKIHTSARQFAIRLLLLLLVTQLLVSSTTFIVPSLFFPDSTPFVSADQGQYLTAWSSGHGLVEVYGYLQELDQQQTIGTIRVATEGSFGSLPDGLLLYNFRQPLAHVWIEGIGYPVDRIPESFYLKSEPEDTVLLVVNSDRLSWNLDPKYLLREYCRPDGESCLQVWNITMVVKNHLAD